MAFTNGSDQGVPNEDQGPVILGATLTVTIAALITMATRLYVRVRMIRNVGWDDYVMISAMVLCIVGQIIIIPEVHYGAGRHVQYIDPADFAIGYKLNFITQPIYLFAICLVKISVGFFLLRIAVHSAYRRLIIGIMLFMGIYTIGCFFTIVLQCTNLAVQWDHTIKATCWSAHTIKTLSYVNVSLNIVTDLLFSIIIPIPLLWSLQMNKRQKSSLMCILGLGIFATAAALIKTSFLPSYGKTGDWLWDSRNLTIWTVVESNIGIVAGNLPCLKPLFRAVLGSTYGRGSRKTSAPAYGYGSRPYGAGTRQSGAKGWGALGSQRTADGEEEGVPRGYAGKESFMLTTINAEREFRRKSAAPSVEEGESTGKSSRESLARGNASPGLGGIKVDTEVNVVESRPLDFGFGDTDKRERRDLV
ncbi:integral membrane family protein [Stagonosporopsis vannaccii]|nr:integral membrane family protein [Stagonosporopsis vannaccii]